MTFAIIAVQLQAKESMMLTNRKPFSLLGIPLLGIAGLVICLWHPQSPLRAESLSSQTVFLIDANPKLDRSMTVFLRQQAKNVSECRYRRSLKAQARTVDDYNIIAQECSTDVFAETHLPSRM